MKKILLLLLVLLVGCTAQLDTPTIKDNDTFGNLTDEMEEHSNVEVQTSLFNSRDSQIRSKITSETLKIINTTQLIDFETKDTFQYTGVEKKVVFQNLNQPISDFDDFSSVIKSWNLGQAYIADIGQADIYKKLSPALTKTQVEDLFETYTFQQYEQDSSRILQYTKKEKIDNAIRIRFETYEITGLQYKRWAQPVTVYAIPCSENLIVYFRNVADTTIYTGNFDDIMRNRQHYLDSTLSQIKKKIASTYALCEINEIPEFDYKTTETKKELVINDNVFFRTNFDYLIEVSSVKLTDSNLAFNFRFINNDEYRLSNDEQIELQTKLIDSDNEEISRSDSTLNAFKGGNRNDYTSKIAKSNDYRVARDDDVTLNIIPELVSYKDGKLQYRYELAPINVDTVVSK